MRPVDDAAGDTAEELFEDAPCGFLTTRPDGTIVRVNRTFEAWTGLSRDDLLGGRRFQDLLSPGGRIYHETHYAPLLRVQGSVREIAVEIVCADGSRLPALVNSVMGTGADGGPGLIRTTVFDATDRRRYERELLLAQRREHEIAERLQRSLLSGALPVADGAEVAVSYRPAVSGLDVGGDWYDAFWVEDEVRLGLVVGDVVGHGIEAAATMGQLRSAVRALVSTGLGPAGVLQALDGYVRRHAIGRMTTLVCAELDIHTGTLRYACAGHPPPLVTEPGEAPRVLWGGRSLPLDSAIAAPAPRAQDECTLPAGTTLLLYTDGLVERRGEALDDGIARLGAAVAGRPHESAAELVAAVTRALADGARDDVCLLAARLPAVADG